MVTYVLITSLVQEQVCLLGCLVLKLLAIIGRRGISLDRVLDNYGGSVYLIQGMHDWNVDPHMAVPTINTLKG